MSSGRSKIIWVTVASALLGALATLFFIDSSQPSKTSAQLSGKSAPSKVSEPRWEKPANNAQNKKEDHTDSFTTQNLLILTRKRPNLEAPPEAAQVREEVALDSHATPRSLLEFAEELGASVQTAYNNSEMRRNVSRQLMSCARDAQSRGTAQAARALCLTNLERLKAKFPTELMSDYLALIAELPDDLLFVAGIDKANEEK